MGTAEQILRRTGALAVFLGLIPAATQSQVPARVASSVSLRLDNDFLALRGDGPPPDHDYTHGTRIVYAWPSAPEWAGSWLRAAPRCAGRTAPDDACMLSAVALTQQIFTPRHNAPVPTPGDRPTAAWLYGTLQFQRLGQVGLHSLALHAGVTGPPALGEQVQNSIHRLLNNHLEEGWTRQLPTRLAATVDYGGTRVLSESKSAAPSRFLEAHVRAIIGTVRRATGAGVGAYWGFGPVLDASADAPLVRRPGRAYVAMGYDLSFVLHDVFVEGSGATPGAALRPWIGEAFAAAGWRPGKFAVEYRYVLRGRAYRSEPGRHAYGSLGASILLP